MDTVPPRADGSLISVEQLLAAARARLRRLQPQEAWLAMRSGAVLVDIRSDSQRATDGLIPGARFVPRNVLEWRLDPAGAWRLPEVTGPDQQVVLFCDEGYASSLAAATLRDVGLRRATDLDGGYQAWLRATRR